MQNRVFREVMLEYDKYKRVNKVEKDKRIKKIYDAIPEIQKIDDRLQEIGIGLSKSIILQNFDREELLLKSEARLNELEKRKKNLLSSAGYPEDYLDDIYNCKLCKDTGYINNNKCKCLKQKLINKYYDITNLEEILKEENFKAFKFELYSTEVINSDLGISPRENIQIIFKNALRFVEDFDVNFNNFLFYGDAGLGKTFLSNCIAGEILKGGWAVLYIPFSKLTRTIELDRFSKKEEEKEITRDELKTLYTVDLLILDDLGTEVPNILVQSEVFNIINSRISSKKQTIISTNLSPENLAAQYSDRLLSRLAGNYEIMKFIGKDIRSVKKYGLKIEKEKY